MSSEEQLLKPKLLKERRLLVGVEVYHGTVSYNHSPFQNSVDWADTRLELLQHWSKAYVNRFRCDKQISFLTYASSNTTISPKPTHSSIDPIFVQQFRPKPASHANLIATCIVCLHWSVFRRSLGKVKLVLLPKLFGEFWIVRICCVPQKCGSNDSNKISKWVPRPLVSPKARPRRENALRQILLGHEP